MMKVETDIFVQKYSTIDAIVSINYSQIENKVESEKHVKARFFTVRTNPTPGASSNLGWGVSEQCCMYQKFCGVSLNSRTSPIVFVLSQTNPTWTILKKFYI